MSERDHNGEPIIKKELPLESNRLLRRCVDDKLKTPSEVFGKQIRHQEAQLQLTVDICHEFERSLNRTVSNAMTMLTEVVELDPRQLVRVTETVVNVATLAANAGHEYGTSLSNMGVCQSDVDDQLYYAVDRFEETQRELIADLWTKVNN